MKYFLAILALISLRFPTYSQADTLFTDLTIDIAGISRAYHLYVPDSPVNAPIVMLFHGHTSSHSALLGLDGERAPYKAWLEIAEQESLMLLIPNGYRSGILKGWNDCRADAPTNSEADDVLFIRTLIDHLVNTYQADSNRIYANGTSNGGHFCIRLAEEIPEKITAFAAILAANAVNSACPSTTLPVSALFMNGTADPILPYSGGQMASNRGEVYSTASTVDYWVARNGTDTNPVVTTLPNTSSTDSCEVTKYEYQNGANNTCVVRYEVANGGHAEPSSSERYRFPLVPNVLGNQNGDMEMAVEVWSFFKNKSNTISATKDLLTKNQIHVYPNPVADRLTIDLKEYGTELQKMVLFNAMGQAVSTIDRRARLINLAGQKPGVYFLRLYFAGSGVTRKLIKE